MLRPALLAALAAAGFATAPVARAQDDDREKYVKARAGRFHVEEYNNTTRLIQNDILLGSQYRANWLHRADPPNTLGLLTPWEAVALVGGHTRWDATHEPLAYFHRTGPVGAVFWHLRTRAGGAGTRDAVGVVGLGTGAAAAYARRGEAVTFYESHPELKQLVADTDRHFTHLADARRRGATAEVRFGPTRKTLADDADKRFAVLLVEMYETGFDPGDRLTLEAVRLYVDRTAPDGIVGLHVSSKDYRLEPVVARIAEELKLTARIWNDDSEGRPGKTASSWVVLARTPEALGPLAGPAVAQWAGFGIRNGPLAELLAKHAPEAPARVAFDEEWGARLGPAKLTLTDVSIRYGPQVAQLYRLDGQLRERGEDPSLRRLCELTFGPMLRPLASDPAVELRTDAHRPALPRFPPPPPKKP